MKIIEDYKKSRKIKKVKLERASRQKNRNIRHEIQDEIKRIDKSIDSFKGFDKNDYSDANLQRFVGLAYGDSDFKYNGDFIGGYTNKADYLKRLKQRRDDPEMRQYLGEIFNVYERSLKEDKIIYEKAIEAAERLPSGDRGLAKVVNRIINPMQGYNAISVLIGLFLIAIFIFSFPIITGNAIGFSETSNQIDLFLVALFLTFIIIRFLAYTFHDMRNYGTKKEKSFTLTGYLRKKTSYDFHHFHLGVILLIITIIFIFIIKLNMLLIIMLAISISLIVDQIIPFLNRKSNYFSKGNLIISLLFHIIISIVALIIYYSLY